jgi:hypothetical protein
MIKPSPPKWIKETPGWRLIILKQQDGTIYIPYSELLETHKATEKYGINTLLTFGWFQGGHDRKYPQYEPISSLGGAGAFKENIEKVRQNGGRIILYSQAANIDVSTPEYEEFGKLWSKKNREGVEYRASWNFNCFGSMQIPVWFVTPCFSNVGWQEFEEKLAAKFASEYRADGILFDSLAAWPAYLCFDKSHPHNKPDEHGPCVVEALTRVKRKVRQTNLDFILAAEGVNDAYGQFIDIFHGLNNSFRGHTDCPEMFRYTFPDYVVTNRAILEDDYDEVNFSFILGQRFDLEMGEYTRPERGTGFAEYVTKLSSLFLRAKEYMIYGTFKDDVGLEISDELVLGKIFAGENGFAIALQNTTSGETEVSLRIDLEQLGFKKDAKYAVEEMSQGESLASIQGENIWKGEDIIEGIKLSVPAKGIRLLVIKLG